MAAGHLAHPARVLEEEALAVGVLETLHELADLGQEGRGEDLPERLLEDIVAGEVA